MPRINTYTDNTSIEDDDKLLTYDTQGAATKLTAFSRIWTWIQSKIHAITASTSAWTAANDKVVVDRNGTLSRIDYSILAKAIVESYNGSTLAGSAQAVKTAIDALNSKVSFVKVDHVDFVIYDDGRIQLKLFKNDAQTVFVLTFNSSGIIFSKSTDAQETYTNVWTIES